MRTERIDFRGAGGIRIAGFAKGPDDGDPVLLAHGGGQTHWAWRNTMTALAEAGFRAVAIDLRGHGESDRSPGGAYRTEIFAQDTVEVVRQIGSRPALVGASLGGISAMVAEGDLAPGLFASLTLVDITARPNMDGVARINAFMSQHLEDGFASLEEAADVIAGYTKGRERRGPSDSLSRYLRKGRDGRFRWHWDPAFMQQFEAKDLDQNAQIDRAVRNLDLPVHLVRGGKSDLVTPEEARAFLELVPHARYTDIAEAGHMVVGDRNDVFSAAILDFLATHRPVPVQP